MRTSHIYLFGVAIATVGLIAAAPGAASSALAPIAVQAGPEATAMTAEQQADFDSWPSEQQARYELWPAETRNYYWSLTPSRQMMFWRLTDEDKIALTAMTGPERDNAWGRIEQRAAEPPSD